MDEWIKKTWYPSIYLSIYLSSIYLMEYYLAIKKKNEIMPFAEKWMEQEIMLSE
jgi:hypothetical protein